MEARLLPTDVPGLVKDTKTGVVLNRNVTDLNRYMLERDAHMHRQDMTVRLEALEKIVSDLQEVVKGCNNCNGSI